MTDTSQRVVQDDEIDHYEVRCMECFWTDECQTLDGAQGSVELHGKFSGCWAAYAYAIYEDGTEERL